MNYHISLLAEDVQMKNELTDVMWHRLISNRTFLVLNKLFLQFLCIFGSTYDSEATFSSLVRRKSKYRTMLSQNSLESELRTVALIKSQI